MDNNGAVKTTLVVYRIDKTGVDTPYELMGRYLCEELHKELRSAYDVVPVATDGSFDTLLKHEALDTWRRTDPESRQPYPLTPLGRAPMEVSGDAFAIGIVQGDVLFHYLNGNHPQFPFGKKESAVRSIARLFPEWLYIYFKPGLPTLQEFSISHVEEACGGAEGTGSLVTSINVGRILHTNWQDNVHDCDEAPLVQSPIRILLSPFVPQLRSSMILKILSPPRYGRPQESADVRNHELQFLRLTEARIIQNAFGKRVYSVADSDDLRAKEDGASHEEDATVVVDAILITTKDLPTKVIESLIRTLNSLDREHNKHRQLKQEDFKNIQQSRNDNPDTLPTSDELLALTSYSEYVDKNLDGYGLSSERTKNLPIAMHKAVKVRQNEDWVTKTLVTLSGDKNFRRVAALLLLSLVSVCFVRVLMKDKWQALTWMSRIKRSIVYAVFFALLHLVVAVMVWLSEYHAETMQRETELATGDVWKAIDWVARYGIVGESEYELRSRYSLLWLGVLKGGYVLSTVLVSVMLWGGLVKQLAGVRMSNHVVVIGWNSRGRSVVDELKELGRAVKIIVSSRHSQIDCPGDIEATFLVRQDDLRHGLRQAGVNSADSVIVLADEPDDERTSEDADLRVVRVLQGLSEHFGKKPRPYVVAEVNDVRHVAIASTMGADEIVCVRHFGVQLLAQSASKKEGLVAIYDELLHTRSTENEIYFCPISPRERASARTFEQLVKCVIEANLPERPMVIGLRCHGEVRLNPVNRELEKSDEAIVLARKQPTSLFLQPANVEQGRMDGCDLLPHPY